MIDKLTISERKCPECFGKLPGRADQKFCSDRCRSQFNNAKRQAAKEKRPDFLTTIPKAVLNNWKILKELNVDGKTKVKKSKMESMGFNFRYLTSFYTTQKLDTYKFCFDQGYLEIKDGYVLLVVQADQVE